MIVIEKTAFLKNRTFNATRTKQRLIRSDKFETSKEVRVMKNGRVQKHEIIIFWDDDDKIFVAEAPELSGCMAHGKTQVEAVQNINDAIELWLETAREFGDLIPEPRRHQLAA